MKGIKGIFWLRSAVSVFDAISSDVLTDTEVAALLTVTKVFDTSPYVGGRGTSSQLLRRQCERGDMRDTCLHVTQGGLSLQSQSGKRVFVAR